MPTSIGSHDSHLSVPDSLLSLSDHASISSAASTDSSLSSESAAQWAVPPDTRSSHDLHKKMSGNVSLTRDSAPQRSATIKALNQPVSTPRSTVPASDKPLHNTFEPSIISSSDLSLASLSPPVLHPLTFADDNPRSVNFSRSSPQALDHAYLALDVAQPRLSSESNSSNELATPENQHQSWPYDAHDGSALAALQASSSASSSSCASSYERTRPIHIQATEPGAEVRPPSREVDASSAQLDKLVFQRPAKLERLSSAATNATARASTLSDESSPHTATQSPRHLQAPDLSSLRFSSGSVQSMSASAPAASSADHFNRSPSLDTYSPSRASMTSPDSWRSLLPAHDPYFASEGQLRTSQHQRSASPQNLHPATSAFDIETYATAKASPRAAVHDRMSTSSSDTARTSFSSAISGYSAMSLAGMSKSAMQSQDSARSDSWRSLLPEDDRYHASRLVTSTGSAQRGLDVSQLLTSPSLSDRLDSPTPSDDHNHRSAFFALNAPRSSVVAISDADSAARRHSSFSSIEPKNSKQFAATRIMLASMRDTAGLCSGKVAPSVLPSASPSSADAASLGGNGPLEASNMTPELSQSSAAGDDSRERDSWPTSRSGRHGADSPFSSGPLTPETGSAPGSKSLLAGVLSQETDSEARVDSPSLVSETSESVVEATPDGLLATTTTTTTKTFITSHMQLLSDVAAAATRPSKAKSEAGAAADDGDEAEALQSQPMKTRTSSCSISTPISPPSLPFLERRPAPPETDLAIETERTQYVLVTRLPGFSLDCITLATKQHKHHRTLHIVADKWDTEGGGHFERRITFPDKECDLKNVKAEFDGNTLRVYVPRKVVANRFSSASSATF